MSSAKTDPPFDWRKDPFLSIHPAAALFPRPSEAELKELAKDIRANGQQVPIAVCRSDDGNTLAVIDGVSRLDAMALTGLLNNNDEDELCIGDKTVDFTIVDADPYEAAISFNLHRRHLNAGQKRDLIAKVLGAKPEASDRNIAKQVKADHKTVAKVRTEKEGRGEIPHVAKRTDTKGRKQPAKKPKPSTPTASTTAPVINDNSAEARKRHYTETEPAAARRGITPPDDGLRKFDALVLELLRRTRRDPGRFAATAIGAGDLRKLGDFLHDLAGIVARPVIDGVVIQAAAEAVL
jgi:ParB-like nuclease domain